MLGNDSLYFAIIPLTPSATKTIILGSPKDSPHFGQKRKITIHCYYSPITIHLSLFTGTIHRYCSLRNFAYLREAVPYIQGIPILAEHLSVIHFSQKFYGMPLLQLCFNIQNAPISAITSSVLHNSKYKYPAFNKDWKTFLKRQERWLQDKTTILVPCARK